MRIVAEITLAPGKGKPSKFLVPRVEAYQIVQAVDLDADTFSLDVGDSQKILKDAYDRDTEIRVVINGTGNDGVKRPMFTGIADLAQLGTQHLLSITGRDEPSVIMDTDAEPGRWKSVKPQQFLTQRARKLGLKNVSIPPMKQVPTLFTDATEKEWQFWYRIVRGAGMYMRSTSKGGLVIDHLAYSPTQFAYSFGRRPANDKSKAADWIPVEDVTIASSKQSRIYRSLVYGEDAKKGSVRIGQSRDPRIENWRRRATVTTTTSTVKTQDKMNDDAKLEIFEGIVGVQEHILVVRDSGTVIEQDSMCRVNLPDYGLVGHFYVVGVTRQGGTDSFTQLVRLRDRGFALSHRVPDAPTLDKTEKDPSVSNKPIGALSTALEDAGIPYGDSFLRAAEEYGVPAGWNRAQFAAVLMSIAKVESGFRNVREGGNEEWYERPVGTYADAIGDKILSQPSGSGRDAAIRAWEKLFANAKGDPDNPYSGRSASNGEAGVGVMQLTSLSLKQNADDIAFKESKRKKGQLEGGRWDPDANIRAGGKYLADVLKAVGADPTKPETIWTGVGGYHTGPGGAGSASATNYANKVKLGYNTFLNDTINSITGTQALPPGSAIRSWDVPGHGRVEAPDGTPPEVAKAITWALSKYGDPYLSGGPKPGEFHFDCSSFAMGAYTFTTPALGSVMNGPSHTYHGNDTTYTLAEPGRFAVVAKDDLKPGDWVFFHDLGHMGIYLGDGLVIHDPHTGDSVKVTGLSEFGNYTTARRVVAWPVGGVPKPTTPAGSSGPSANVGAIKVMIQAGHDVGSHADQPYGHTGESGATGEQEFTKSVRDLVLAHFAANPKYEAVKGTAWDASAGAGSGTGDDIDSDAEYFLALHYDKGTAGSAYFFGYTRGTTDGRTNSQSSESQAMSVYIRNEVDKISGHPSSSAVADNTGFGGSPANAAGWGYYAWGSTLRAAPDNVNHLPRFKAALIMECGRASDASFLDNKRNELAKAIYDGMTLYIEENR